jgi:6-phosphogluconolactonase
MANDKWKMNRFARREFLKTGAIGTLGAFVFRGPAWPQERAREVTLYVGTYTSGKSEGVYIYRMDRHTGALAYFNSIKAVNPSFLTIDRSRRYLYAVNEVPEFGGKQSGAVSAFAIDPATGNLRFLNQQASLGADPCHLTVDRKRKNLLVANYTGGNVAVLPIQGDGSLGPATDLEQHEGSSTKEQQKGPHAHCIILDRSDRHALAADLGIDKVMIYGFDQTTGKLRPGKQPWAPLHPGAGPRHLTLHPSGKFAYVINELDSTVTAFKYDGVNATLSTLDTVSTLPSNFSGSSYCADVHVAPSGKFLYGSNRGHDSIVGFAIDERTGRLKQLEHVSTEGKWPRNFTIDPTGRFLLVANQHTDNVVTFKIDAQSGRLKPIGLVAEIPVPVCLKFA